MSCISNEHLAEIEKIKRIQKEGISISLEKELLKQFISNIIANSMALTMVYHLSKNEPKPINIIEFENKFNDLIKTFNKMVEV